jgi:RHS repeat-associated protein
LYRGEQHDPDLGLYYLRARYYNPLSGRFTGVDPLTDQGQPRYEYAGADPVNGLDPMGTEDMIECALLGANKLGCPFQFPSIFLPRIPIPNFCQLLSEDPGSGDSSKCRHWTVRVNYRPILTGKYGKNCEKQGIPGCHLPFRLAEHSYVEIDGPTDSDKHTWGVLGVAKPAWENQEMVKDYMGKFQDPLYGAPGIQSKVVQATDKQASDFEDALNAKAWPSLPPCPSCGSNYHNFAFPPRRDLVSLFTAYNSNTFTWNAVKNAQLTPPGIGNAPGYHFSPRYGSYPF